MLIMCAQLYGQDITSNEELTVGPRASVSHSYEVPTEGDSQNSARPSTENSEAEDHQQAPDQEEYKRQLLKAQEKANREVERRRHLAKANPYML